MSDILIVAEHRDGEIRPVTHELIKKSLELKAQTGGKIVTAILGCNVTSLAERIAYRGADEIIVVDDANLENYTPDGYTKTLANLIQQRKPILTLIGHTAYGIDFAPKLAARLNRPLVTDCIDIRLENQNLLVKREMYNGKVEVTVEANGSPEYIVTMRVGASGEAAEDKSRKSEIVTTQTSLTPEDIRWKVIGRVKPVVEDVDIVKANVIVSIGRGIKDKENIPLAQELADTLSGVLACSRPIIDKGWLGKARQVGTSGKIVKPKLYLALGISGATQHITGMKGSDMVVAINKDPKAPIFKYANYGVVDDLFKIVPLLTKSVKS